MTVTGTRLGFCHGSTSTSTPTKTRTPTKFVLTPNRTLTAVAYKTATKTSAVTGDETNPTKPGIPHTSSATSTARHQHGYGHKSSRIPAAGWITMMLPGVVMLIAVIPAPWPPSISNTWTCRAGYGKRFNTIYLCSRPWTRLAINQAGQDLAGSGCSSRIEPSATTNAATSITSTSAIAELVKSMPMGTIPPFTSNMG